MVLVRIFICSPCHIAIKWRYFLLCILIFFQCSVIIRCSAIPEFALNRRNIAFVQVASNTKFYALKECVPFEPRHDKTKQMTVRPAKTQISLGIRPVWSVFAVRMKKAWVLSYPLSASEDSDQTGRMPRLIWVFAGRTVPLLVLSCRGSFETSRR